MKFLPALITNTLLPLIALTFGFTVVSTYPTETLFWLQDKSWIPYPLLIIAAVIASQFNQSRYFYVCLLWLGLFTLIDNPGLFGDSLASSTALLIVAGTSSILLWQQDKGLRLFNILLTLTTIAISAGIISWLLLTDVVTSSAQYQSWSNHYAVWFPSFAKHLTLLEVSLYVLFFINAAARVSLPPKLNHSLLAASLCLLVILHTNLTLYMMAFASSLFAVITVIIVLLDSHTMAFKDELTGISSRRALMHFTKSLFNNYTVVMADVDHFKAFNDKYGHDVGDQVLRMVAQQLNQVGKGGRAFRYGGEEFTLVFPRKKPEQVFEIVDQLRDAIANYPLVIRQPDRPKTKPKSDAEKPKQQPKLQTVHVTMSFGAALKNKQTNFEKALKLADEALYKAKKAGRNNVQVAES